MSTITDTLVTVLRLEGVPTYVTQMARVSKSVQSVAVSQGEATAASGALGNAFAAVGGSTGLAIAGVAALTIVLGKALSAFSDSEDTIARLAIRMRNLGNVFPIKELTEFSSRLGQQLGIDDELIAKLGATAAGFGLTRQQIEKTVPTVLDIATALKEDPNQVLNKLLRASRGRPQGLVSLGIDPSKIKGDLRDINNLINQVGSQFAGTAAAFRNTLPGTVSALQVSIGNLFEAIGRFISPAVVPVLNLLIKGIDSLTNLLSRFADFLHIPTAADIGGGNASKISFKGDPEQTEALNQIAENTSKTTEAIIRNVLGGPGTIAKQAFTWRDAQMAFKI
jgi:hypothetical protein